ncbi:RHS repeat domain-containing protein, partial [Brevibacillus laterosporus]|uniref:RHS repeat domain-containing protein n=1 Tax=Brevibacillus laterosporus TaxID=1465 RepID=UPI00114055EC
SHVNEQPVEMDADGNLLVWTENEQTHTYAYDARNRLVRTGQAHYTYDAEHLRTSMTWKGKTTRYVVDQVEELSRVLMELGGDGSPKAYYVYGQGLIGREDAQGNYLSYHTDMRGSTTMLSDWSGRVTDRYSYGVYGELEQHDGTTSQPFCYNGRDGVMTDPNGLYYMRARYYHPGLKRFLNRDILPGDVTEGQTFNRFAYVNGDPVGFIDPLGLAGLGTGQCQKGNAKGTSKSKPVPNPNSKASAQVLDLNKVDDAAKQYASSLRDGILNGTIRKTTGGKIDAKVLSVGVDKKTGEMFYGISGSKNNPTRLNETHTDLQKIIDRKGVSETNYPLDNCGEFNAINHALFNGNKITDLKIYTINIRSGEFKEMCLNCDSMYSKLVTVIK